MDMPVAWMNWLLQHGQWAQILPRGRIIRCGFAAESALQILFDSVYYFITRLLLDMSTPEYDDLIEVRLQNRLIWRGFDD